MTHAERFGYWAIQWSAAWDPSLTDLLRVAPELVLGRRVAITSCDSGPYMPSEDELSAGWSLCETTAISREIAQPAELPAPGFDEWYVFDSTPQVVPMRNHVIVRAEVGWDCDTKVQDARAGAVEMRWKPDRHSCPL